MLVLLLLVILFFIVYSLSVTLLVLWFMEMEERTMHPSSNEDLLVRRVVERIHRSRVLFAYCSPYMLVLSFVLWGHE